VTNETHIRRYLLGTMSPHERASFEAQCFEDSEVFEAVVEAEHDLIDAYVKGKLGQAERQQFERQYHSLPGASARIQFARTLAQISKSEQSAIEQPSLLERIRGWVTRPRPVLQWAFAATILIALAIGLRLLHENRALRTDLPRGGVERTELLKKVPQIGSQPPQGSNAQPLSGGEVAQLEKPSLLTFRLKPGMTRSDSGERQELNVTPEASWIRLELLLNRDEYSSYEAILQTVEGTQIQRVGGLKSERARDGRAVIVKLQSALMPPGDYIVSLRGTNQQTGIHEETEAYSFRILSRKPNQ
jgi:hypothetical protein